MKENTFVYHPEALKISITLVFHIFLIQLQLLMAQITINVLIYPLYP
jgi:hypothetical protein